MPMPMEGLPSLEQIALEPDEQNKEIMACLRWKYGLDLFCLECLRVKPTKQQDDAIHAVNMLIWSRMVKAQGRELTEEEAWYAAKRGISIMAGAGVGKDAFAAWLTIWIVTLYHDSKIPAIAPNADQLRNVLVAEVYKFLNERDEKGNYVVPKFIRDMIVIRRMKIFNKAYDGNKAFLEVRSVNISASERQQAESIQGRHEKFMIPILEEASGLKDPVFQPLEGSMTDVGNFGIIIFNPTRNSGYAYQTHYGEKDKKYWIQLHWNAEKCERIQKDQIEFMKDKYGENSNLYRMRVKGLPPIYDEGAFIPIEWIKRSVNRDVGMTDAEARDYEHKFGAFDPSRLGTDETAFACRAKFKLLPIETIDSMKSDDLVTWIRRMVAEYELHDGLVEVNGLGGPIFDFASKYCTILRSFDACGSAVDIDRVYRARDQAWWDFRCLLEKGLVSLPPDDEELIEQLAAPLMCTSSDGKIKVESKADMRARKVASPNKADATVICFSDLSDLAREMEVNQTVAALRRQREQGAVDDDDPLSWLED